MSRLRLAIQGALTMLILVGGIGGWWWLATPERSERPERTPPPTPAVRVYQLTAELPPLAIATTGVVRAERTVELEPQLTGPLITVSDALTVGRQVPAGTVLAVIDPVPFELAVAQAEAELAIVDSDLVLEQGNQIIARKELELIDRPLSGQEQRLVLREPQLAALRARRAGRLSTLRRARVDLERTWIYAPFDAVVLAESAAIGMAIRPGSGIATLAGTDRFLVEVNLPAADLGVLQFSEVDGVGSTATIIGAGVQRNGVLQRRAAALDPATRLTRLFIAVADPLSPALGPLLLDSFVEVLIDVAAPPGAVAVPDRLLRFGDRVWLVRADGTLAEREVTVVARREPYALVTQGLAPGDRVVELAPPGARDGMAVEVMGAVQPASARQPAGGGGS